MNPPPAEHLAARIFVGPALRAQPDRRLVDLVRDGYDTAFEEIVRRYRRPLDRFAAAIVGGRSEDVTQDAFSKALLALRGSEAEIELRPWLYRIVRNTALNDLRDRGPATEELAEALPGGRSAAAEAEAREELTELMERLRALPEPQRAAIVMRELEGLSHEEIAAALGVSGGAARQAIFRARAALREGLGLLVPLPVLRMLIDHGGEAAAGGAIAAGAGAGSAGALKIGMATVLVAGTVGAGVAIEQHRGNHPRPEQAEAAPLVRAQGAATSSPTTKATTASRSSKDTHGSDSSGDDHGSSRHGSDDNSGPSSHSGSDDSSSHPSGSDDRSGSNSGSDDGSSNSGPGSTDSPDGDPSPAGGDDGSSSPSGEEDLSETGPAGSALQSGESGGSGSDSSGSSTSGSGTSGSGDLSTSGSSGPG